MPGVSQDNEVSWFDWSLLEKHKEIQRFTRGMIAFRRAHLVLRREEFYTDADIKWFAPNGATTDWGGPAAESLYVFDFGTDRTRFVPPV
jgi:glycogen operon protein